MEKINIITRKKKKAPNNSGLYLIGDITFNPNTKEIEYWIKVGLSIDLSSRINCYYTHNPSASIIDYYIMPREDNSRTLMEVTEADCHRKLRRIAKEQIQQEWFKISEENYNLICIEKFSYFRL